MARKVGILVFDGVEELDFAGPLEVFGSAAKIDPESFQVFTVGVRGRTAKAINGLSVTADYSLEDCPRLDILVVPGGRGTRTEMKNPVLLSFIRGASEKCELVASVCTGSLVLAAAGLLDGKRATTHRAALNELRAFPKVHVEHRRYIRQGRVITSAGISAGIDMALYLVGQLRGERLRRLTAEAMEYQAS